MTEKIQLPPEPPVPADADLRAFPFTPIFRSRLFGSSFHARVNDSEWRAGVTLWLKSWDQVPAGSLPDDDIDLCRLAELGRETRAWKKLRDGALRGWYRCNDGRLYHLVVAEGVNEALEGKRKQQEKTLAARIGAMKKRLAEAKTEEAKASMTSEIEAMSQTLLQLQSQKSKRSVTEDVTDSVTSTNRERKGEGDGKGQGEGQGYLRFRDQEPTASANGGDDPRKKIFDLGKTILGANAGGLISKAISATDEPTVGAILGEMALKPTADPRAYFAAAIKRKERGLVV